MKNALKLADWTPKAERQLRLILRAARTHETLAKKGAFGSAASWSASVRLVGTAAMARLNGQFRGKPYATDVLSFGVPEIFHREGHLGELVICLPTLARQARERGHDPQKELRILLVHGVLHLLGLDHERGPRHAAQMARWENRLLHQRLQGLISR